MTKFAHDTVVPRKESTLTKKEQVADMFDDIAFRYDFLNRFLSAGIDIRWRKKAIQELAANHPQQILDVATGTADLAIMANKILQPTKIVGIDISKGMLNVGKQKIESLNLQHKVELILGDSEAINFLDNTFDAVMVAFGVRNFQNLEKGLSEIKRVLKPGGKLVVLECSQPKTVGVSSFFKFYMNVVTPAMGKLFSKNKGAYTYLNESIQKFPEGKNFVQILNNLGYTNTYYKSLTLGVCSIYCGEK